MKEQELRDYHRKPNGHGRVPTMYPFACYNQVFQGGLEFQGVASGKLSCCRTETEGFVPAARQLFKYAITARES